MPGSRSLNLIPSRILLTQPRFLKNDGVIPFVLEVPNGGDPMLRNPEGSILNAIKIVFVEYAKNYFFFAAAFFTGFFASGFFAAAFFAAAMLVSTSYRKGLYFLLIYPLINILVALAFLSIESL